MSGSTSAFSRFRRYAGSPRDALLLLGTVATWLPLAIFFRNHVAQVMTVTGPSMAPLLSPEYSNARKRDVVFARMWEPAKGLRRGMVVSFWTPHDPERMALKRVVALEGDVVHTRAPYPFPTAEVPAGHVWLEGEDRVHSIDSNTYGPVSKSLITGRVTHILWLFTRAGEIPWQGWKSKTKVIKRINDEDWTD